MRRSGYWVHVKAFSCAQASVNVNVIWSPRFLKVTGRPILRSLFAVESGSESLRLVFSAQYRQSSIVRSELSACLFDH